LGFASFFDPNTHGQSTAVSQFLMILTMMVFLSLDGHLLMVTAVANSFNTMPIALGGSGINPMKIVTWAQTIFSTGLLLALPAVAALLMTNMALGILTKTAPQLNIFGIGFPITLSMGLLIILLTLPGMLKPIQNLLEQGVSQMSEISTISTVNNH
jgi:flagellar biosynthetic protein FliR